MCRFLDPLPAIEAPLPTSDGLTRCAWEGLIIRSLYGPVSHAASGKRLQSQVASISGEAKVIGTLLLEFRHSKNHRALALNKRFCCKRSGQRQPRVKFFRTLWLVEEAQIATPGKEVRLQSALNNRPLNTANRTSIALVQPRIQHQTKLGRSLHVLCLEFQLRQNLPIFCAWNQARARAWGCQ